MATYPQTYISRTSKATPDAGIVISVAADGTLKFRKDRSTEAYAFTIVHEWLSQSEYDALLSFISTNGFGPHDFTLHGVDYSITLSNMPEVVDYKGSLRMVQVNALGTAV